jgi:hypothetical protein
LAVPLEHLFGEQSAGGEIFGEKVNKAAIFAKDVPLFSGKLLRELEKL